uniref:Putative subtilisin inhibitor CLSI-I n=1 Tax=Davidia involucrata TaxID=16924 RepID=A0A5B7CAU7_DAVIN
MYTEMWMKSPFSGAKLAVVVYLILLMAEKENQQMKLPEEQTGDLTTIPPSGSQEHMCGSNTKTTWPEVVGLTAEEAERKIKEDMPRAQIQVVPPNHFVTMDYRGDRVRLFIDSSGKVSQPPRIG